MTHQDKINYMRIASGIACFSFKNEHLDLLVSLYELVVSKEGKTTINDVVDVELEVEKRQKEKTVTAKLKDNERE